MKGRPRCAAGAEGPLPRSDELELKYVVSDMAALESWLDAHFPIESASAGWQALKVTDRYFDTADGALARAGYGARLRQQGARTKLGVKSDVSLVGALHHRREWEAGATAALDPNAWPRSRARAIVRRATGDRRLLERFVLVQRRRQRDWQAQLGSCQFSLDWFQVRRGRGTLAARAQLEVELTGGDKALLADVAHVLEASGLVAAEARSKMAIAAEIVEGSGPVRADEPFAEAGRRVLRRHLERMLDRERETRAGDGLALKQMRVATRRMRATWRLFDGAYRRVEQRRYLRELRRIARRLGAVRDLDVLLEKLPPAPELDPLAQAWRNRRERAWRKLLDTLDSDAYCTFTQDYRELTHTPGLAVAARGAGRRVRDIAGSRIWAAYERVAAHQAGSASADVALLHALRIDGKRLRYALETFADVLPPEQTSDLIGRLTAMQDHLGALNDGDMAAASVTAWLNDHGSQATASTREAVEAHLGERRAEIERLRLDFGPTWRRVGGRSFQRRLAETIGRLGE